MTRIYTKKARIFSFNFLKFSVLFICILSFLYGPISPLVENANAAVANNGRLYYGDATNTALRFQTNTYDFTFGGELSFTHGGSASLIAHSVAKAAPTRDEMMIGALTVDGQLKVINGINGSDASGDYSLAWANTGTTGAQTCNSGTQADCTRAFDISYERLSGRAMVVYADTTNQKLYYALWNGTSWSPNAAPGTPGASNEINLSSNGRPTYVSMKAKPGTNEILMGVSIDVAGTHEVEVYRWNGTAWGDQVVATATTNAAAATALDSGQAFDVEWESLSGDGMVVWGSSAGAGVTKYKIFTGGAWQSDQNGPVSVGSNGLIITMQLDADPVSNRIAYTYTDDANDGAPGVWKADGSTVGWTMGNEDIGLELNDTGPQYTDVIWEQDSSEALWVAHTGGTTVDTEHQTISCNGSGCTFGSIDTNMPTAGGDDGTFVRLTASPNNNGSLNDIMVLWSNIDRDFYAQHWDGSAWEGAASAALEADHSAGTADSTQYHGTSPVFTYIPYSPWSLNWRFFDDETVDNPSTGLNGAAENTTPTNVDPEEFIRLRINMAERSGQAQTDARKKLQYTSGASCTPNTVEGDTDCTWVDVGDTSETSAVWRYATTGETCAGCADGSTSNTPSLTSTTTGDPEVFYVSDKDAAADTDFDHNALQIKEIDIPLKAEDVGGEVTYYFRLYDVDQDKVVRREQDNDGNNDCASAACTYPSVTTAKATTLSTGTNPGDSTIAPASSATRVNSFVLTTSSGTDAITAVTVSLPVTSSIGTVGIYSDTSCTASLGTVGGGTGSGITSSTNISITSTNATTGGATFHVCITPRSHTTMPAVPGASYAITGNATTWTGTNTKTGTSADTSSTLTIDNASPGSVIGLFGTSGVITSDAASNLANDVAIDSTYMYVVGGDSSNNFRIEKRLLSTGAVDNGFGTSGVITGAAASNIAYGISIDSTYMYVVGNDASDDLRIEKRLLSTGAVDNGFGTSGVITGAAASHISYDISIGSTYMYVVGSNSSGNFRIEKRLLSTGAVDNGFGTSGVITGDATSLYARAISIDSTYMYVVGYDTSDKLRIEKRLLSTGAVDNGFGTSGVITGDAAVQYPRGISIDSTYMYVISIRNDRWRIEKRLLSTGALDNGFGTSGAVGGSGNQTTDNTPRGISIDSTYMYVVGSDSDINWRIEKRLLSTGAVDNGFGTSGVITSDAASKSAYGISINSTYMYVAGNDNNNDWRIEKRLLSNGALGLPTATAGTALVDLAWGNPSDSDFTTGGTVVVLRRASNAISQVPVEGTTYTVGQTIGGTDYVACVVAGSPPATTCQDTGLSDGTPYHYKIFTQDSRGNYDAGVVPEGSPATPSVSFVLSGTSSGLSDSTVIKAVINGVASVATGSVTSNAWSFVPTTLPTTGQSVLVFVDNVANELEASVFTKYDGADSITGVVLTPGTLTIGSIDNQSISLTDLSAYTCASDEDVMYSVVSSVLNVEGQSCSGSVNNSYTGETLSVLASNTLTVANGETVTTEKINNAGTITATDSPIFNLSGTSGTLFTNSGTFTAGSSTVNITGNGNATINSAAITFYNLNSSGTGIKTMGAGITFPNYGSFTLSAGTLDPSTFLLTGPGGPPGGPGSEVIFNVSSGATIRVNTSTFAGNYPADLDVINLNANSTVDYILAGTQTISNAPTYGNLTISGSGTKTLGGNTTAAGTVTVSAGTLDTDSVNNRSLIANNLIINGGALLANASNIYLSGISGTLFTLSSGTFTAGSSTVNLSGNGSATINFGSPTFYNLTSYGTGTKTLGAGITLATNGTLTVSAGTFDPSTFLVTGTGTNTLSVSSGATIRVGASTFAGSYSAGFTALTLNANSTTDYNLAGTQTVDNTLTYGNLTTSGGSGTKTLGGNTSVVTVATIGSGTTLGLSSYTLTLSNTGTPLVATGTLSGGTGKVAFTGDGAVTIPVAGYYNLEFSPTITDNRNYTLNATTILGDLKVIPTAASALELLVNMGADLAVTGTTSIERTGADATSKLDAISGTNRNLTTGYLSIGTGGTFLPQNSTVDISGTSGTLFGNGNFIALSQTVRNWEDMTTHSNGNVYATVNSGDIYMQTNGTGNFVALSQTNRDWRGISAHSNGNVYATVNTGDIYMQTNGTGDFVALSQTVRDWRGITAHSNGNVYASVNNGDIYMQTNGTGNFIALSQTVRNWEDMTTHSNGNVYATVNSGDIYMQTNGTGNFVALSQTNRDWRGISAHSNGNVYATVNTGDIYMQTNGTGDFVALSQTVRDWRGITAHSNGNVYASVNNGDIYMPIGGTFTASGSTVNLSGGSAGINLGSITFNNLTSSGTGTKTFGPGVTVGGTLTLTQGTLSTNNNNISMATFSSSNSNTRAIIMGSATWSLTSTGTVWDASTTNGLTMTPNTSTIKITNTGSSAKIFAGGGATYNNLWLAGGAGAGSYTISGNNFFNDFKDDSTMSHSILFTTGSTQTIGSFTVSGANASNRTIIDSTTAGTHNLVKTGNADGLSDFLDIRNSAVLPHGKWLAGLNSIQGVNVSGWVFNTFAGSRSGTGLVGGAGGETSGGGTPVGGGTPGGGSGSGGEGSGGGNPTGGGGSGGGSGDSGYNYKPSMLAYAGWVDIIGVIKYLFVKFQTRLI